MMPTVRPDEPPAIGGPLPEASVGPIELCNPFDEECRRRTAANIIGTVGTVTEAAKTIADPVGKAADAITNAVLGPIAEVALTVVLTSAGAALVVWGLIQLGKGAGINDRIRDAVGLAANVGAGAATGGAATAATAAAAGAAKTGRR